MSKVDKGLKITIIGIVVNFLLATVKIAAGILGTSYALIADGIESTTDIFSSLIVWSGLKIASKPPDDNHPYGHGKAEAVAAFIVSIILLAAAIVIVVNSVHEIITPHHAPAPFTLIVLVLVVAVKEFMYRKAFLIGNTISSTAVKTDAWHHRSDAVTSLAAFIGIAVSLIMGKGYESADDFGALIASGVIVFNAFRLLMGALSDIMDETPSKEFYSEIVKIVDNINGVNKINGMKIRKSGLHYLVDMNVEIDGNITVYEGHLIAESISDILTKSNLSILEVMVHIEPHIN